MMNMKLFELLQYLEPLTAFLGTVTLLLLLAVGFVYLIKILFKPILVTLGCVALCCLLYNYLVMLVG